MKMKQITIIILVLCLAATLAACGKNAPAEEATAAVEAGEAASVGEGSKCFTFRVEDSDGSVAEFEVHTDADTVGEALLELGLIDGEEGPYGLYVKVVNGITADWDTDGTYWAFYVDGEYALAGVDQTEIDEGCVYAFVRATE